MKIHIVQKGDTLWKIAKKYGVNFEELKQMNTQLSNPDMIMPGMKIKVPTGGGSIKKEAPISGQPETKINMGAKKEMPLVEHPFTKEKPKEAPIVLAQKEAPKKEMPIQEAKKPYTPKMPQPIIPEIDIHNYYMMNMANVNVQPQVKPIKEEVKPKPVAKAEIKPAPQLPPKPVENIANTPAKQLPPKPVENTTLKPAPQLPPKPKNIFPEQGPLPEIQPIQEAKPVKPIKPIKPVPIVSPVEQHDNQGECYQPMYPTYPQNFNPYQQPMQGYGYPNTFQPQPQPFPQVQGAMTGMPMMPGVPQMPQMQQMNQMGMQGYDDESSSFMPQMPMMPSQVMGMQNAQMPNMPNQVMGMQDAQMPNMPNQVMGMQDAQMPNMPNQVMGMEDAQMPMMPNQVMGVQDMPMQMPMYQQPAYPYPPYCAPLFPAGPMMPGPGQWPMMQQPMPTPYMPQVQGVMDQGEPMPNMPHANQPMPMVQGAQDDCGCGSPSMQPTSYPMPGMPPVFAPAQGFSQPPYMNPYGYGPGGPGMARGQNPYDRNEG